jgi:predicted house-cleaning noncanonical NTP pyrophosphatase (MazG superfamily)|tara:strand:- start:72 stop:380 length:309 start_codon:yes stop_codon:yes gene_type:complete
LDYDKLVRDKIPEIIKLSGKQYTIDYCSTNNELKRRLVDKLSEEGEEYLEKYAKEELADLLQIIYFLIEISDSKLEEIVDIMTEKRIARGGFSKGIILKEVN